MLIPCLRQKAKVLVVNKEKAFLCNGSKAYGARKVSKDLLSTS